MDANLRSNIIHISILAVLALALVGILIYTGLISCNIVPGGCELYYLAIKSGPPLILVLHGDYGMGNASTLVEALTSKDLLNKQARIMHIDRLTYANVRDYDMIIVEQAKKICTNKLSILQFYVASGGRLVWTGDAGTEHCPAGSGGRYEEFDNYLLESERTEGGNPIPIGPWARRDVNSQISFDLLLGVNYRGNYCEFAQCEPREIVGRIESVSDDDKLVYGLSPSIPYSGDFAIVELNKSEDAKLVATLDYGTNLLVNGNGIWLENGKKYNFGRNIPFIVTNQIGERVAYYAVPLESFVSSDQPQLNKAILEQMYYGMLYD